MHGSNCKWQHCQIFQCPFGGELFIHICTVTRHRHLRATDCNSRVTWQSHDRRKERRRQREADGLRGDQNQGTSLRKLGPAKCRPLGWLRPAGTALAARLYISLYLRLNKSTLSSPALDIFACLSSQDWFFIWEAPWTKPSWLPYFFHYQHARRTVDYNAPPQPSSPHITTV